MAFLAKNQTHPLVVDCTGYTPYVVARVHRAMQMKTGDAKARCRDAAVRDYWIHRQFLADIENYVVKHNKDLFRSQWECSADKKGLYSRVKWEMDKVYEQRKLDLEERRNRLSKLLQKEEQDFLLEVHHQQETPHERKADMQSRYEYLRMKKEKKRTKIANEKKQQQWRSNCDELRELTSKKTRDQVYAAGMEEVKIKDCSIGEKEKENKMYAEMWIKDSIAKEEKEIMEEQERTRRNIEYSKYVQEQINAAESKNYFISEEKKKEADLMQQQQKLMELEKEWEKAQKRKAQERMKKEIDKCLKNKLKRRTKEVQEDLMLDLHFLTQIAGTQLESRNKELERKRILLQEQQNYLQYLMNQVKQENEFEKELDKMHQEESEKMWQRKQRQWEDERMRRQQLNQKTLKECYEQIQEKWAHSKEVQKLRTLYGEQIQQQAQKDIEDSFEAQKRIRERNCKHQKELLKQIKERECEAERKTIEKQKEIKELKQSEENFEKQLHEALADVKIDNMHPYHMKKLNMSAKNI